MRGTHPRMQDVDYSTLILTQPSCEVEEQVSLRALAEFTEGTVSLTFGIAHAESKFQ
jgi:hypothetical protein